MDCGHVYQLAAVVIHRGVYKCTNEATHAVTSQQSAEFIRPFGESPTWQAYLLYTSILTFWF